MTARLCEVPAATIKYTNFYKKIGFPRITAILLRMTRRPKKSKTSPRKRAVKANQERSPKPSAEAGVIKPDMTMQEAAAHILRMMRSGMKMDLRD